MRSVAIIGIGMTTISEHWDQSIKVLAGEAVLAALADAGREAVDGLFIGNMLSGTLNRQENLGAMLSDWVGLRGAEAVKIEAACGSGGAAVRQALMAVASGVMDSALAVGVEKMTDTVPATTTGGLATAADSDWEAAQGVSFVALNALVMQRYLHEYGWTKDDFAPFAINAHGNAMHNPFARLHEKVDARAYKKARMVAEPINLLDASPTGDGAAAVLIVPAGQVSANGRPRILIAGSASATDTLAIHDRRDPLWLSAAELSARKAYSQAGVGPAEIDVFELHDAFSIMAALSLEACGFAERGQGPRLALDGEIVPTGRVPIATRGGLKARGHPVGATGVYQVCELVEQLRGTAAGTQVDGARIGMAQNIGGSGATIVTHILRSE
ncbi:MAG TPA: thiolase domain-containing protein [Anaerolineales bacterium]|nr:thiolase domain-containing protein [Anaerolineales bacterium]